ncbi:hypothetical protein KAI37_02166 [Paenibacillus sp. S25]|nr:hypothetical protein KAI37_02166 [Paenibacillus sp. S25]
MRSIHDYQLSRHNHNHRKVVKMMYSFKDKDELIAWIQSEIISASEAMEILDCTKQNLHSFVKRGKLVPVKETGRERFFLRDDVLERKAEASIYNRKK